LAPMCSPALVGGDPPLRSPEDLRRHHLIHTDVNLISWAKWLDAHQIYGLDLTKGLRFDRSFMAIEAAVEGLGVILDSDLLAMRELASGRLVRPFEGTMMQIRTAQHFFVAPASKMKLPRVLRFRDWLFEGIRHAFEGK
jgi:LysR family transcriptional regulator, glycine cleavage system transcriptional activator